MAMGFKPRGLGLALENIALPGPTSGFGGGAFNMDGTQATPVTPHAYAQDGNAKPKGGFFREGGMGRTIAGLIGDALLQQADMAPVYSPAMRQQQAMRAEEAQWSRRRQAEREDKQWEWQNKPRDLGAPHYWETNDGSLGMVGPDGKPQILFRDPTPKMNFIPDGLGGGQWVAVPGQAPSMPTQGPPPVGAVIPDPRKAGGPGATPGNFPGGSF